MHHKVHKYSNDSCVWRVFDSLIIPIGLSRMKEKLKPRLSCLMLPIGFPPKSCLFETKKHFDRKGMLLKQQANLLLILECETFDHPKRYIQRMVKAMRDRILFTMADSHREMKMLSTMFQSGCFLLGLFKNILLQPNSNLKGANQ